MFYNLCICVSPKFHNTSEFMGTVLVHLKRQFNFINYKIKLQLRMYTIRAIHTNYSIKLLYKTIVYGF